MQVLSSHPFFRAQVSAGARRGRQLRCAFVPLAVVLRRLLLCGCAFRAKLASWKLLEKWLPACSLFTQKPGIRASGLDSWKEIPEGFEVNPGLSSSLGWKRSLNKTRSSTASFMGCKCKLPVRARQVGEREKMNRNMNMNE